MSDEMSRRWQKRNDQLQKEERREKKERFAQNKAYQKFLLDQAAEKRRLLKEERGADLKNARLVNRLKTEDEGRFLNEVMKTLAEMSEAGGDLNTIPVQQCLNLKEKLQEAM